MRSFSRVFRAPFCYVILALVGVHGQAGELSESSSELPVEQYRVLDWRDLMPENWERPVIARAYDADSAAIDEDSVVSDLDGQLAALPGYMQPVVYKGNKVYEFLLVPFIPQRTFQPQRMQKACAHVQFEPNQQVYVYPLEPIVVTNRFEPIWIVGSMSLEPVMADSGPVAYRMVDAVTTPYEY